MPNFLAHSFTALFLGFLISLYFNLGIIGIITCSLISFIFSAIPDIDHHNSKTRKFYRKILSILLPIISFYLFFILLKTDLIFSILISIIFSPLLILASEFLIPKHRTLTHSIPFAFFISVLFLVFLYSNNISNYLIYSLCGFLGICSHILLDTIF
jgi:hypothetical protein